MGGIKSPESRGFFSKESRVKQCFLAKGPDSRFFFSQESIIFYRQESKFR